MIVRGPAVAEEPQSMEVEVPAVDHESMLRQGVKGMLDELVPQKGENAAKHQVAEAIAKELVAKGLIQK
eukprot:9793864-Karenia_brevis.AAC.1